MRRNFIWSSAIALAVAISSVSHADVIEFSFEDRGSSFVTPSTETFGSQIENTELAGLAANPVTITLNPDTGSSPDATSGDAGDARLVPLQITAIAGTGTGATAHFNASTIEFGIDSVGANPTGGTASDSSTRLDADFDESFTLSFSEDLFFREIDLNSLSGSDVFSIQVAGSSPILIPNGAADTSDRFDFSGGTAPSGTAGLFISAGTGVTFRATAGSVGLDNLVLEIAPVPEPGSLLGLMGLAGLFAVKRRRR